MRLCLAGTPQPSTAPRARCHKVPLSTKFQYAGPTQRLSMITENCTLLEGCGTIFDV